MIHKVFLGVWGVLFAFVMGSVQAYYARYFTITVVGYVSAVSGALTFIFSPVIVEKIVERIRGKRVYDYSYSVVFACLSVIFPVIIYNLLLGGLL